jgi:flavodoxin
MKILIIFHSDSGNTRAFAQGILAKLTAMGHTAIATELQTEHELKKASYRDKQEIKITNLPDPADFDAVLVGGPVWAFGPSPLTMEAIQNLGDLSGKICHSFITMHFFAKALGGSAALKHMNRALAAKGGQVGEGFVCYKMRGNFPLQIENKSAQIAKLF